MHVLRKLIRRASNLLLAAAGLVLTLSSGCGGQRNDYIPPPPPEVIVAQPLLQAVVEWIEVNGQTEAVERAEVRARVRGFVQAIEFSPGQAVDPEKLLYRIEPDEYQSAVNSAVAEVAATKAAIEVAGAQVASAEAESQLAQSEWQRQEALLNRQATSQADYDLALARRASAIAAVAAAKAGVQSATALYQQAQARLDRSQLDLGYTQVTSPIAGSVTKSEIKLGNLVDNGMLLCSVVGDRQMFANFTISERDFLQLRRQRELADQPRVLPSDWGNVPIYLRRDTDTQYTFTGRLDYVSQEGIDQATGSLSLRGIFDNPEKSLVPGLFVHLRMPIARREEALLIPARALQRDRTGAYLMVVNSAGRVSRADVLLGKESRGWVVIDDGLGPQDQVIIDGLQRVRPGAQVTITSHKLDSADVPAEFRPIQLAEPQEVPTKEVPTKDIPAQETPLQDKSAHDSSAKQLGACSVFVTLHMSCFC